MLNFGMEYEILVITALTQNISSVQLPKKKAARFLAFNELPHFRVQGSPCMAIKLQPVDTILTFGGSLLFKVLKGHLATFWGQEMKD